MKVLKSKSHDSSAKRAVPAVVYGIMGTTGTVNNQRMAQLDMLICGETDQNDLSKEMIKVYKQVSKLLVENELAIFDAGFSLIDAGFSLIDAVIHGIERCVLRLAANCTFGETPGEIPVRTSDKGRPPSRHQVEIIRPLARKHGKETLPATEPDETITVEDDTGTEVTIKVWHKVYFLERHLDRLDNEEQKKKLRRGAP
ncbi:MAG: hypothetical protein ACI85U_002100 [Candidatus Promineifilaceae bacterium]